MSRTFAEKMQVDTRITSKEFHQCNSIAAPSRCWTWRWRRSRCRSSAARTITWVSDRTADWETYVGYGTGRAGPVLRHPGGARRRAGLALHFLLGWLLGLPWLPFRGPLTLLDSIPDQIALPVLIGLGMVAGRDLRGVRAAPTSCRSPWPTTGSGCSRGDAGPDGCRRTRGGVGVPRRQAPGAARPRHATNWPGRRPISPATQLAAAFTGHGYPWRPTAIRGRRTSGCGARPRPGCRPARSAARPCGPGR